MNRNVTAIYRTFATADLVRRELIELGVSRSHIHVIPDRDDAAGTASARNDDAWMDQLHELHLPNEDVRTYQHSVRRGDYVVSANVDDDALARVQAVMRRPESEAYDLDASHQEFRQAEIVPRRNRADAPADPAWLGQPDATTDDRYTRTYRRNKPIGAGML